MASTKLDPVLREVAGLAVGVAVDNHYGVAFHSTMLASLGLDEADIDAMRRGRAPSDDTAAATHLLAREVVLERGKVSDATITQATEAGLDTEAILEIVLEVHLRRPRRHDRQPRRPCRARRLPRSSGLEDLTPLRLHPLCR